MADMNTMGQGLLSNPLFGMGIGLLTGAAPGGTFGQGAQTGLMNMMAMQRQGQLTAQNQLQMQYMQQKMQEEERIRKQVEKLRGQNPEWLGQPGSPGAPAATTPYQMTQDEMFPGEAPIPGLMTQTPAQPPQEATGLFAQDPTTAGMLQTMYQVDPVSTTKGYMDARLGAMADLTKAGAEHGYKMQEQQAQFGQDQILEGMRQGKPFSVGKNVYIPGQGFVSPTGGAAQPELSDMLAVKKSAQPRMDMFRNVARAGEAIKSNLARQGPFSDVQTLVSAVKVLDPESVVREGEVALPLGVQGLYNQLLSKIQSAKGAGFLTPEMKADIAGSINNLLRTYEKSYAEVRSEYDQFAPYGITLAQSTGNPISFPDLSELAGPQGGGETPKALQGMNVPEGGYNLVDDGMKMWGAP